MNTITTVVTVINVISAAAIIILVLMQQGKSDMGSAFGGGGSQSMFGSRGSANFLSRSTSTMCIVFFLTSLALAYLYMDTTEAESIINTNVQEPVQQNVGEGLPSIPVPAQQQDVIENAPLTIDPQVESVDEQEQTKIKDESSQ